MTTSEVEDNREVNSMPRPTVNLPAVHALNVARNF